MMNDSILCYSDIIKLVSSDKCFFAAFCITPWHILGAKSFLKELFRKKKNFGKAYLFILPHGNKYLIDIDDFKSDSDNNFLTYYVSYGVDTISVSKMFTALRLTSKYNSSPVRNCYIVSAVDAMVFFELRLFQKKGKKNNLVVIDEGNSGYLSPFGWYKHILLEDKNSVEAIKRMFRMYLKQLITRIFDLNVIDWKILRKTKQGFEFNKYVIARYLQSLPLLKSSFNYSDSFVLFLSQPPSSEEYKKDLIVFVKRLALITVQNGIRFVVKLHPRDDFGLWRNMQNIEVLNSNESIEGLYLSMKRKPKLVLGMTSTALVSLKGFFDSETISVMPAFHALYNTKLNYDENFFVRTFSDTVRFVMSFEEYRTILFEHS